MPAMAAPDDGAAPDDAGAPPDPAPADAPGDDAGGDGELEFRDRNARRDLLVMLATDDGRQVRLTRTLVRRLAARGTARGMQASPSESPFWAVARALRRLVGASRLGRTCAGCAGCAACTQGPVFVAHVGDRAYQLFTRDQIGMAPELVTVRWSRRAPAARP
ncbi:MAG: hypothetical protein E6J91_20785 [Deltaproteobacteria bacterium]|nr:MAG: hypothetical protein E6J91_20785 [Deltaproteobacteria bacterium]